MRLAAIIVLLAVTAAACGDSSTGPSSGTRVEAIVQDSPSNPTVTGRLAGDVFASLWDGSRWVDLGSPNGITIPLQNRGSSTTVHGEASVPSGFYSRVRLVFQGVAARIDRGSVIGGSTLANDATLALGGADGRAEMIVPVSRFSVEADSNLRNIVAFDLRSQRWLTAAAVQAGRVEDAALQAAVTATIQAESR